MLKFMFASVKSGQLWQARRYGPTYDAIIGMQACDQNGLPCHSVYSVLVILSLRRPSTLTMGVVRPEQRSRKRKASLNPYN